MALRFPDKYVLEVDCQACADSRPLPHLHDSLIAIRRQQAERVVVERAVERPFIDFFGEAMSLATLISWGVAIFVFVSAVIGLVFAT